MNSQKYIIKNTSYGPYRVRISVQLVYLLMNIWKQNIDFLKTGLPRVRGVHADCVSADHIKFGRYVFRKNCHRKFHYKLATCSMALIICVHLHQKHVYFVTFGIVTRMTVPRQRLGKHIPEVSSQHRKDIHS
jgi:hypothetical protein